MMKKMKRLIALLMTMAMVMGMGVTAFAAPRELEATASITINHLTPNDDTVVKIYQVVQHNAEKSKWEALNWAKNYVTFPEGSNQTAEINWDELKKLASAQNLSDEEILEIDQTSVTFDNLKAGAYLVIASGTNTQYNVMGVVTYKYDDNKLLAPLAATIDAKGQGYTVTKRLNGKQTLVNRGDELTFDIESVFPSFAEGTRDRTVTITDRPTGQKVKEVTVYVGGTLLALGDDYTLTYGDGSTNLPAREDETVTVNFTSKYIGTENEHAAQAIKVVVKTIVTDVESIINEATGSHDDRPTQVDTATGSITITKLDEAQNKLTGAKFSFKKRDESNKLMFVKVSDGVYKLAMEGELNTVDVLEVGSTDTNKGVLKVQGLGQGTYEIVEEKAPDGYSVVEVDDVELTLNDQNKVKEVINTKLSSLPSTGGIGTTIFTIAGCAIMIAAAGLFFATRKKA